MYVLFNKIIKPIGDNDGFKNVDGTELITKEETQRRDEALKIITKSMRNATENMAINLIIGPNA